MPTVRYLMPLKSSTLGNRLLEPAERLGRHRARTGTRRRSDSIDRIKLGEKLLAAAVLVPGQQHVGVHGVAGTRAPQRQRRVACRTSRPARRDRRRACPSTPRRSSPNACTTAPAGSTSILRSPPVMSLTFLAKSSAYSWKMSFVGQVLCHRIDDRPLRLDDARCDDVAAPAIAAPVKNLRRVAAADSLLLGMLMSLPWITTP